jgi:drug/metabolite transporter (DMT)-like permease
VFQVASLTLVRDVTLLGCIWGATVVLQRGAVAEVEPFSLVSLRLLAALLVFLPFLARVWRGLRERPGRVFDVWVLGALDPFLTGVFAAVALTFASSGIVALLAALAPVLTALLGRVLLGEPAPDRRQLVGIGVAFGGVLLLLATGSTGLGNAQPNDARGLLAGLAVALTIAIFVRWRLVGADPLAMAAGQVAGGLILVGPAALTMSGPVALTGISLHAWIAIVLSGAFGIGASFWLYLGMVGRHGPTAALLAMYIMPVAAMALGALLLDEQVTLEMAMGAALVLGGVILYTRG